MNLAKHERNLPGLRDLPGFLSGSCFQPITKYREKEERRMNAPFGALFTHKMPQNLSKKVFFAGIIFQKFS